MCGHAPPPGLEGAIRFHDPNGLEVWGLLERTQALLAGDAVVRPKGRQTAPVPPPIFGR